MQIASRFQYDDKVPHAEREYGKGYKDERHRVSRAVIRDKLKEELKYEYSWNSIHVEG